ncbi:MAG: ABC transporter substrate-binding protein [Chloroflexota bacterium]|nr:ABC transporter substrate-binding protein [Chloroflexota bacterium]
MSNRNFPSRSALSRRTALKAGSAGIASILLSRQAPAVIAQDQVEISFAGIRIFGDDPMPALLAQFEEENPNISVRYIELPTPNNSTEIHQYLVTSLNAQNGEPDVFTQDIIWIAEFGAAGLSAPLEQFGVGETETAEYFPGLIEACTYQDQLVGWPWFVDAGFLYYRSDLLDAHGLDAPATWDDLIGAATEVMAAEENPELLGFLWQARQAEVLVCDWVEFLGSAGGRVLTDGEVTVNSEAAVSALQLMQDLIYTHQITPEAVLTYDEEPSRLPFTAGNGVFLRNWSYVYAIAQNPDESRIVDQIGYQPLPMFADGENAACLGGYQFGLNATSAHPEEAFQLLQFLSGPEAQKTLALQVGVAPTRQAVYEDAELGEQNPFMVGLRDVFTGAIPRPVHPAYPQISLAIQSAISGALTNQTPPQEALDSLAEEITFITG